MTTFVPGPAINVFGAGGMAEHPPGGIACTPVRRPLVLCSLSQATLAPASTSTGSAPTQTSASSQRSSSTATDRPAHDVVAGAMARAASQSTIHPLDTMKVRMQLGKKHGQSGPTAVASTASPTRPLGGMEGWSGTLQKGLLELASLYKGVLSAATGAGIIIGAYFAFYSTSKKVLKERTELSDGSVAFISGATAAVGSSFVKVPIAVCIRSVQAGLYPNVFVAAQSISQAAGARGLFAGFVPTLLEDAPDMAVKFAVYESLRPLHNKVTGGREPGTLEDLVMGGVAGAAAAAATTPLDVVKTRMMCSASKSPTVLGAVRSLVSEGEGLRSFFRGLAPRVISNGLNTGIFFCFFEAIRKILVEGAANGANEQSLLAAEQGPSSTQREQEDSPWGTDQTIESGSGLSQRCQQVTSAREGAALEDQPDRDGHLVVVQDGWDQVQTSAGVGRSAESSHTSLNSHLKESPDDVGLRSLEDESSLPMTPRLGMRSPTSRVACLSLAIPLWHC